MAGELALAMRVPFYIGAVFLVLWIGYKTTETGYQITSYTAKTVSETIKREFKFPNILRNFILQLERDERNETTIVKAEDLATKHIEVHINGTIITEKLKKPLGDVCLCDKGNCSCCLVVDVPEFSHSVCVNATYNPKTVGLNLSIGVDGHYFSQEISLRNPPPFCFTVPIPGAEPGICVAFKNMDVDKKTEILSGCVELDIELLHFKLIQIDLGCFQMPI